MDESNIDEAIQTIDKELASRGKHVGILFGVELFCALSQRGFIRGEKFGVLGSELFLENLPAYKGQHHAIATCELDDNAFIVGGQPERES